MKRHHLLAIPFLFLFTLISCDKEELVQPEVMSDPEVISDTADLPADSLSEFSASTTSLITSVDPDRSNLLIEERFESPYSSAFREYSTAFDMYDPYYRIFSQRSYGFTTPRTIARRGSQAARFEMRRADSGVIRAEFAGKKAETSRNRWYGLSLYLPSTNWGTDSGKDIWDMITQFNGVPDAGEPARNPPISLYAKDGRLYLKVIWDADRISSNSTQDGSRIFDLGLVEKNKWLDFVYHINYSYGSDGILEVWKNGSKIVSYRGPNSYNDAVLPYFKAGIYKRKWNLVSNRVLYVDEVRVGNGSATYSDVAP